MPEKSREILKKYFETGDTPTSADFSDLIDSTIISEDDNVWAFDGKLGIGARSPENNLEVTGNVRIGSGIVGEKAPTDGLLVKGGIQIGVSETPALLNLNGSLRISGSNSVKKISGDQSLSENSETSLVTERAIKAYVDNLLVGSITAFATDTPPEGWLECNGYMHSREKYKRLFKKIGTQFGHGDGATTFNVPNLQGQFIRGWDREGLIETREFGSHQSDQIQTHVHNDQGHSHSDRGHTHSVQLGNNTGSGPDNWVMHCDPHGGDWGHSTTTTGYADLKNGFAKIGEPNNSGDIEVRHGPETRPKNVALLYCIKY